MPVKTSAASASCGTHFGLTKLVASMLSRPVAVSRSISSIFAAVGTSVFSFCSPSRGPTSTMRTATGRAISVSGDAAERAGFVVEEIGAIEHGRVLFAEEPVDDVAAARVRVAVQVVVDDRVRDRLVVGAPDRQRVAVEPVAQHD